MDAYVRKARSAFYPNAAGDKKVKAYLTFDLFQLACKMDPVAGRAWQARLAKISEANIRELIAKVPASQMSDIAREFTEKLLKANSVRLINLDIQ